MRPNTGRPGSTRLTPRLSASLRAFISCSWSAFLALYMPSNAFAFFSSRARSSSLWYIICRFSSFVTANSASNVASLSISSAVPPAATASRASSAFRAAAHDAPASYRPALRAMQRTSPSGSVGRQRMAFSASRAASMASTLSPLARRLAASLNIVLFRSPSDISGGGVKPFRLWRTAAFSFAVSTHQP